MKNINNVILTLAVILILFSVISFLNIIPSASPLEQDTLSAGQLAGAWSLLFCSFCGNMILFGIALESDSKLEDKKIDETNKKEVAN